MFPNTQKVLAD